MSLAIENIVSLFVSSTEQKTADCEGTNHNLNTQLWLCKISHNERLVYVFSTKKTKENKKKKMTLNK